MTITLLLSLSLLACQTDEAADSADPSSADDTGDLGATDGGATDGGTTNGGTTDGTDSGTTDGGTTGSTDGGAAPCPAISSVTAEGGADQLLEVVLSAESDLETAAWALCAADDDPEERHLAESGAPGLSHRFTLHGLAPERAYTCEVYSQCLDAAPASVNYTAPALPEDVGGYEVTRGEAESWGSYTLFTEIEPCQDYDTTNLHAVVVDSDGEVRWLYEIPDAIVSSDVDARYLGDGVIHIAGGWGTFDTRAPHRGMFKTLDLSNTLIHERTEPGVGWGFNHHSERLETGEFLTLTYALHLDRYVGLTVEVWDPDTDEITWSWDSEGVLVTGAADFSGFWAANSVSFVEDELGSAMYLSVVTEDELWRVDRGTGELTHVIGHDEGWALVDTDGRPLDPEDWFFFQHDPEYRGGRVLLHDNGQDRPGGEFTRVAEYELDLQNQVMTLLWSWEGEGWYNPYLGDADRLENGNVLAATGQIWCAEGRSDDVSSLIEIEPASGEEVWRMDWPDGAFATYRAERIDGCEIFSNAATCPELSERIDALTAGELRPGR